MAGKRTRKSMKERVAEQERRRQRGQEASLSSGSSIRTEMQSARSDQTGTGPSALGRVKMTSEEGARQVCGECGFTGGRHMSKCPEAR